MVTFYSMQCLIKKKILGLFSIRHLDQVYAGKSIPQKRTPHFFPLVITIIKSDKCSMLQGDFFPTMALDQLFAISFLSTTSKTYSLCLQSPSANSPTCKIPISVPCALLWPQFILVPGNFLELWITTVLVNFTLSFSIYIRNIIESVNLIIGKPRKNIFIFTMQNY